jgi:transposase-like protein
MLMMPEFEKTKEWKEYECDYLDEECFYSFGDDYGGGLKKGAPEWLVKAVEEYAEKLRRIREIEEREGVNII